MKIVSWNVNSIKARLEHVKRYLQEETPDILLLQELKGLDFPSHDFKDLDYETRAITQKAYNGVAIISKHPIEVILDALPNENDTNTNFDSLTEEKLVASKREPHDSAKPKWRLNEVSHSKNDKRYNNEKDEQARYIEANINGVRIINIYMPNGNPVDSEKYDYKLKWMERLYNRLKHLCENNIDFIIGGDFNVIPEDKDCYSPNAWKDDALFRIETRKAFRSLVNLGLTDAFRVFNQQEKQYSFWDYQKGAWQKNNGIRIDHFLLSPNIADRLTSCKINKEPRGWDKPSDHTPIELKINEK